MSMKLRAIALFSLLCIAATTQPASDRSTPVAASKTFLQAMRDGDERLLADCIEVPADTDGSYRKAITTEWAVNARLRQALIKRFGQDQADAVAMYTNMRMPQQRETKDSDFVVRGDDTFNAKLPVSIQKFPVMHRREGVWRLIIMRGATDAGMTQRLAVRTQRLADAKQAALVQLEAGKFATADELIKAINPRYTGTAGTIAAQADRRAEIRRQQEEEARKTPEEKAKEQAVREQQEAAQRKMEMDPSTPGGGIRQLADAVMRKDVDGVAKFYCVSSPAASSLIKLNARRIVGVFKLSEAGQKMNGSVDGDLRAAGILRTTDDFFALGMMQWDLQTNVAHGTLEEGRIKASATLRKINGIWKMDVTPTPPTTLAVEISNITEDVEKIEKILTRIESGKISGSNELRQAISEAKFSGAPQVPGQ